DQVVHAARVEDELVRVGRVGDEHRPGAPAGVLTADDDAHVTGLEALAGDAAQLVGSGVHRGGGRLGHEATSSPDEAGAPAAARPAVASGHGSAASGARSRYAVNGPSSRMLVTVSLTTSFHLA